MTGSSNQLTEEEAQYLSLLLGIIESKNWPAVAHAILSNTAGFQAFAEKVSQSSELNGLTLLHSCVRFNPPRSIVEALIELVPESPSRVDCLSRTPLHVAAGTRADLPIMKLLAGAFPGACEIQDVDGKTPLHLACDTDCELFEDDRDSERELPSYEVVETLVMASPASVSLEDRDDMSALEHAILSNAPIEVVKLLQLATRTQCRARRVSGSGAPDMLEDGPTLLPARKGTFSRRRGAIRRNSHASSAA